jgi:hypothetical protein
MKNSGFSIVAGVVLLALLGSVTSCSLIGDNAGSQPVDTINGWALEYASEGARSASGGPEVTATKSYTRSGTAYQLVVTGDKASVLYAVKDEGFGIAADGEKPVEPVEQYKPGRIEEGKHYSINIEVSALGTAPSASKSTSVPPGNMGGEYGPLGAGAWVEITTPAVLGTITFYVAQHDDGSGQYDWYVYRWQTVTGSWLNLYSQYDITDYKVHSYQFFYAFFKRYYLRGHTDTKGVILLYSIDWWF